MYRRWLLNILCMAVLIFVSSPLSIFMNLKSYDNEGYLEFNWTGSSFMGQFFRQHLPPLVVVLINNILLTIIGL